MRIATCQYQIENLADWNAYQNKIENLIRQASEQKADLLLFPEYAGVEIARGFSDEEIYQKIQPLIPNYLALYQKLAQQYQLYIQPGTILEATTTHKYRNRAYFFGPNGQYDYQDKLQLTESEKQQKILQSGHEQIIFETAFGKIAIAVCYDSEFPELINPLVVQGAWLILVPSYTSSIAGNYRVKVSCQARAMENQCYVARAAVVGNVENGDLEKTFGQAGIYGPMDNGFPDDGIIKQGTLNQIEMITADIDPERLSLARDHGQVHNLSDAGNCQKIIERGVRIITL